ncbi:MAG: hypothetical protein ACO1RT_13485 [Planctomycetaceae bacterium]
MRIDSSTATSSPVRDARAVAGQRLQVVFSEVLEQAGQTGYASADAYQSPNSLQQDIEHGWANWFAAASNDGAYATDDRTAIEQGYGQILVRSWQEGGYRDPRQFLRSLSRDELKTVQHVFRLAEPIAVDSLSEEGALNLLIPPPAQVDANRDGLTHVGAASMMRFPDSQTPANVVAAWDAATAGMDRREKMTYAFRMKASTQLANLAVSDRQAGAAQAPHSRPGFVDPMTQPNFSYGDLAQRTLDSLERFKYQTPPEQYSRQSEFWTKFRDSLRALGAW